MKKLTLIITTLVISSLYVFANDDGVFLSLTRKAENIKELPTNVSVITESRIKESDAKTLGEVLEFESGITISDYGTLGAVNAISVRGSTAGQVLVMIDGRRINETSNGQAELHNIPADTIERIEIIRGSASAIYGSSALGGVVNVITKTPKTDIPETNINISYGSFETQNYAATFMAEKEKLSYMLSANKKLSAGWRDNSKYDGLNLMGKLGFKTSNMGDFNITISGLTNKIGQPGSGATLDLYDGEVEKTASLPDAVQKNQRNYFVLEHSKNCMGFDFTSQAYLFDNARTYESPSTFEDNDYASKTFGYELKAGLSENLTLGAEWYEEMYKNTDNLTKTVETEKSRVTTALYGQDKFKINKLTLIPSTRIDLNSVFGNQFSPQVSAVYGISDHIKGSLNGGLSWKSPTFNDLYWPYTSFSYTLFGTNYTSITDGNPDLKPEKGVSSDIGLEYSGNKYRTKLTCFLIQTEDLISWKETVSADFLTSTWIPENTSKAKQDGIEFEFSQKIMSGLNHKLNYTYLWAIDTDSEELISYKPTNTINHNLTYEMLTQTKFTLESKYVSPQKTSATTPELPEYALFNLKIAQAINAGELFVRVNNIGDKDYQTRRRSPLPGRTVEAGLNFKFSD